MRRDVQLHQIAYMTGSRHRLLAAARVMERRGEVDLLIQDAREIRPGVLCIPYVRRKSRRQVRAERAAVWGGALLGAWLLIGGVLWMFWVARYVIGVALAMVAAVMLVGFLCRLFGHWARGCAGSRCRLCGR